MKTPSTKKELKELLPDEALDNVKKELKKKEVQIHILKKLLKTKTNH
jgi:hypothetical protein